MLIHEIICLQEPGPHRQLNIALGIVLPADMVASGSKDTPCAAALHQSLLQSVSRQLDLSQNASACCIVGHGRCELELLIFSYNHKGGGDHSVLCLQVHELAHAAGEADLQELYASVPELLSRSNSTSSTACALLQVCTAPACFCPHSTMNCSADMSTRDIKV